MLNFNPMKNINKLFACCLVTSIILTGCFKERIDLELNNENNRRLVVNAWITNADEPQSVNLSYTSDYFDQLEKNAVENADITMKVGETETSLIYSANGDYLLPGDWRGKVGETYLLTIDLEGESYMATSTMRPMPEIENVFAEPSEEYESEFEEEKFYDVYFSFLDNEGEGDGYYGIVYPKGTLIGDSLVNGDFINDEFIDGAYFEDVNLTYSKLVLGDTAVLDLHSIGIETSAYLQDIQDEIFRGGLFDPAPVNVRSNFTNGALGYFITSGMTRIEYVIEE